MIGGRCAVSCVIGFFYQYFAPAGALDCGKMTFRSLDSVRMKVVWEEKCVIYDCDRHMGRWGGGKRLNQDLPDFSDCHDSMIL